MTDAKIFKTGYDRAACSIGLVHIGYGAFHRAHQAVYLDDYMQATGDLRWGIAAVNLRASESAAFRQAAQSKDGYALKTIAPDGTQEFRVVRSHLAFVDAAQDLGAALDLFADPKVTAATVTVTESGYSYRDDWTLDLGAPAVAGDLSQGTAQTIYGFLARALAHRAAVLDAPLTVLCCDNIRRNGTVLEAALLSFLEAAGQDDLAGWVRANVRFPCSMVDRITPRATAALSQEVAQVAPRHADSPVHSESFTQWVLQDHFAGEMPDLTRVGVQVVDTVDPFEEAKIRILNGGHTGLAYLGALAGYSTFDQAMGDPALRAHFDAWEEQDVLPGLAGHVPFDTTAYLAEIARRFENPGIADQLERICMDGYAKMGIYICPTIEACLAQGRTPNAGYDCIASWVVFARKAQAGTAKVPYQEPLWDRLQPLLNKDREGDLVSEPTLWGALPKRYASFAPALLSAIHRMEDQWQD
ncbi:mannitol dehydrogenase [Jannaschia pagri]|uniref:Mannitol dehydrogenase n=1 Tax=Jannaschia pagri TaxID=2829797 RepID=A0ABQ4NIX3_9RHOB|nr:MULTISPECIES: mannitol dehydrogenase family protein [unclassified Jannaschia]GIT89631.1 mannitol dehydrogenase [Jannaschia sp. AI_61]GIT94261.1 mannitol dehydrogenase [Jannaschia sp. AI_62]